MLGIVDHIALPVSDFDRSVVFYVNALKPLGISLLMQFPADAGSGGAAGFGKDGKAELWLGGGYPVGTHVHLAFAAANRPLVKEFLQCGDCRGRNRPWAPGHSRPIPCRLLRRLRS